MKGFDRRAIIVIAAGFILSLVLGVLYSWSVMSNAGLQEVWGWTAAEATFPYALAMGMFALSMTLAGVLQDKFGPRIVSILGGVLCGLGLLVSSFGSQDNHMPIIIGFGVLSGVGIGTAYACTTPAAIKWFGQERKGLVTGIVVCGFGLSSVYLAPLTTWLLSAYGINGAFRILGIAFMIVAIITSLFIVNPPKGYTPPAVEHKDSKRKSASELKPVTVRDYTTLEMLKTPKFYVVWLAYACATFAGLMIIGHLARIAEMQLDLKLGFLLVAFIAIGNAAGRLISGILLDKIGAVKTMLIIFIGQALAMLLIGFTHALVPLVILTIFIGAFYGSNLAVFPGVVAGAYGTRNFGANYGLVFTAFGIGGVFGSIVAGSIVDSTGSYQVAFYIAAALCAIAAFLAPYAGKPLATKD